MQSEELWPTQNPQPPCSADPAVFSPPLSSPFRLPSPPSLFLVPSPFPSLFLSRFLSIFLSFFFFLSLSFPYFFFVLHGVHKVESDQAAAREVSLPAAAFQLLHLELYSSYSSFSSSKTFQNWNQMLRPLDAVDARWRSSAPMSVISNVGRPSMVCARGLAPRGKGFMSCSSTVSRAID